MLNFDATAFTPPNHPAGMQALLEHSQKSYVPLPSDLRPRRVRSRTSSMNRPFPYPRNIYHQRSSSQSSTGSRRSSVDMSAPSMPNSSFDKSRALQAIPVSQNFASPPPALANLAPFSPFTLNLSRSEENPNMTSIQVAPPSVIKPAARPRVGSAARKTPLGWAKKRTPKSKGTATEGKQLNANKENEAHGLLTRFVTFYAMLHGLIDVLMRCCLFPVMAASSVLLNPSELYGHVLGAAWCRQ